MNPKNIYYNFRVFEKKNVTSDLPTLKMYVTFLKCLMFVCTFQCLSYPFKHDSGMLCSPLMSINVRKWPLKKRNDWNDIEWQWTSMNDNGFSVSTASRAQACFFLNHSQRSQPLRIPKCPKHYSMRTGLQKRFELALEWRIRMIDDDRLW